MIKTDFGNWLDWMSSAQSTGELLISIILSMICVGLILHILIFCWLLVLKPVLYVIWNIAIILAMCTSIVLDALWRRLFRNDIGLFEKVVRFDEILEAEE